MYQSYFLVFFLGLTFSINAQTSVISLKSHHGDLTELPLSNDKFGNPPINFDLNPPRIIAMYDTLELINSTCVKRKGEVSGTQERVLDTICDTELVNEYRMLQKKMGSSAHNQIVFIGFDSEGSNLQIKNNPYFKKRSKSSVPFWFIIPLLFIGLSIYVFQPQFNWKK